MAFPNNCNPRILAVSESCGCTLTRASIGGLTPQGFENLGATEIEMHKVITRAAEAKVAGYRENTLEMLLMANMKNIKGSLGKAPIGSNESVILPYIYKRQKRNINSNYWKITAGSATSGAGSNGVHAGSWDLTIANTGSTYASTLVNIERYFPVGTYLLVEWVNTTSKVKYGAQFKVTAAVNATADATVTVEPAVNSTTWAGYSAAQKLPYQPTFGLALNLANSVSDYESWCHNDASDNTNKLLTFWPQTIRETHCYNDEYLKALNASLTSGYFKDFQQLPLAEQKKQQHAQFVKRMINTAFYGQRINDKQAVETYTQLPVVVDPMDSNCTLEYKANALGFKTQLADCSRVADLLGGQLDLDSLASISYDLKRAREAGGGSITRIDWGTDRFTAGRILDMMVSFYKAKYGVSIERHYQPGQSLVFENQVLLTYNVYQLPPELGGIELAVWTDPYFDDKLSAAGTNADMLSSARTIWGLDFSDVVLGIGNVKSVSRQTNVADDLYNCVIQPNVRHYQLTSTQICPMLEDPARHYIIDNFSDACPKLTVSGCGV